MLLYYGLLIICFSFQDHNMIPTKNYKIIYRLQIMYLRFSFCCHYFLWPNRNNNRYHKNGLKIIIFFRSYCFAIKASGKVTSHYCVIIILVLRYLRAHINGFKKRTSEQIVRNLIKK